MAARSLPETLKGRCFAILLRLMHHSWRVQTSGRQYLDRLVNSESRFLLCFWHGEYVPLIPLLQGCSACVISSRSKRGSVIAEICRNFGYQSGQISDRPGAGGLRMMAKLLNGTRAGGIAVDGPQGPYHHVKSGTIRVASALGFVLLPVSVSSQRKIVLNKRWDRMEMPLPFTAVCMDFGRPIKVPSKLGDGQVRKLADRLGKEITTLGERAQHMACEDGRQVI